MIPAASLMMGPTAERFPLTSAAEAGRIEVPTVATAVMTFVLWAFSFSSMVNTTLQQGEQVRDLKAQQFQVVLEDGEILVLFRFWVELGKLGPPDKCAVFFLLFRDRYRDARQADTLAHLPYIVFIEV